MNLQRFVNWCETAGSRERAEGFVVLANAVLGEPIAASDREAAVSVLSLVLDDPAPKVRLAVAEAIGGHPRAPIALVRAMLFDGESIALAVARSPVLEKGDLLDAMRTPHERLHAAIASRPDLSSAVLAVIAGSGSLAATIALLRNDRVYPGDPALRLIAERHGRHPVVRSLLADRPLPPDIRQTLVLETGKAIQSSAFVAAVLGASARRVVYDACERATALMAEHLPSKDAPVFAEHLVNSGQLSVAFLLRAASQGNIDMLAAALTALSGISERRVRSVLVECREGSFHTLAKTCGLSVSEGEVLRVATRFWKEISVGRVEMNGADATDFVMRRLIAQFTETATAGQEEEALALLRRLQRENARDTLRQRTRELLAA